MSLEWNWPGLRLAQGRLSVGRVVESAVPGSTAHLVDLRIDGREVGTLRMSDALYSLLFTVLEDEHCTLYLAGRRVVGLEIEGQRYYEAAWRWDGWWTYAVIAVVALMIDDAIVPLWARVAVAAVAAAVGLHGLTRRLRLRPLSRDPDAMGI